MCADDVGSGLKAFRYFKKNVWYGRLPLVCGWVCASTFKCFLVVTCVPLTPFVKQAIAHWLSVEIPARKNMQIVDKGKYLGVYLGVGGCEKTFTACEQKHLNRCFDISLSVASALLAIVKYNERAVPVFSYVSQVLLHPDIPRLKRLEQRGIHKVFKLPPSA